jgi:ribosome-binding factor A
MSQRTERLDELLRQEIGAMLEREVADPRIGFATVTDVETTTDLRHAKVWISVIGPKGERPATLEALEHAMHFIRRELGTRLRLKRIPELHVRLDDSLERGTRLLKLIGTLEEGGEPDATPMDDSLPTPTRGGISGEPAAKPGDGAAPADGFGAAAAEYAATVNARRRPGRAGGPNQGRSLGRPNAKPRRLKR